MNVYQEPKICGRMTVPVLEFLTGLPWNCLTKNMLISLRPSVVQECWDFETGSSILWRVTVWLQGTKDLPKIKRIEQEVSVGLVGEVGHGGDLEKELRDMGMRALSL